MNEKDLEIARAFVACPGWVWMPGMQAAPREQRDAWTGMVRIVAVDGCFIVCGDGSRMLPVERVPDISDPLTAAGMLVVVRRAWGHALGTGVPHLVPRAWTRYDNMKQADWDVVSCGGSLGSGDSEVAALLAALRAAP